MKKIILIFLFLFLCVYDAYSYANTIQSEIAQNVIRLHVIANSDSMHDQELKLKVRDAILNYMKGKKYDNYKTAYQSIKNSQKELTELAQRTLLANHSTDNVHVELGKFDFPLKTYGSLSFPSGNYTALRITLGEGKGHNWWCVMYPTLCFTGDTCETKEAQSTLQNALSKDSFSTISNNCTFRFKIVEFFQKYT